MIDDDGTADFDAVAAVDGENVYVTWINAKRIFTPEEAEAEDFMTKSLQPRQKFTQPKSH